MKTLGDITNGIEGTSTWRASLAQTPTKFCMQIRLDGNLTSQSCGSPANPGLPINFDIDGSQKTNFIYGDAYAPMVQSVTLVYADHQVNADLKKFPEDPDHTYYAFAYAGNAHPRDLLAMDREGHLVASGHDKIVNAYEAK